MTPYPEVQTGNEPTREQAAVANTHSVAGYALGDIAPEWPTFALGLRFAGGEFQARLVLDFALAWGSGSSFNI